MSSHNPPGIYNVKVQVVGIVGNVVMLTSDDQAFGPYFQVGQKYDISASPSASSYGSDSPAPETPSTGS